MTCSRNDYPDLNCQNPVSDDEIEAAMADIDQRKQMAETIFAEMEIWQARCNQRKNDADFANGFALGEVFMARFSQDTSDNLLSGNLLLNSHQMLGFSKAYFLDFNHFDPDLFEKAVRDIDALNITHTYGPNNASSGGACTYWRICLNRLDYIDLEFTTSTGINELTRQNISLRTPEIEKILRSTMPDYVEFRETFSPPPGDPGKQGTRIYSVQYQMFWD